MSSSSSTATVAEDLSRMEGEYGARMIGKLKQMHVLIIGMRGLGLETAKNLILAGPHSVVVHDDEPTVIADLGAAFYLHPQHVGKPRGPSVVHALGELNPNVNVDVHTGAITPALLHRFDVVVVTVDTIPLATLQEWNRACRTRKHPSNSQESAPTTFLVASTNGATAFVFADFGPHHHCFDHDGVQPRSVVIDGISNAENGVITIDGDRHLLNDGDWVKIEEVKGMAPTPSATAAHAAQVAMAPLTGNNEPVTLHNQVVGSLTGVFEIRTTKNPKRFTIGDTRGLGQYESGGVATQVKKQVTFAHHTLEEQLYAPTFIAGYMDFTKFGRDAQLHLARLALWRYQARHQRLPRLHNAADADELVALAKQIAADPAVASAGGSALVGTEVDESVIRNCALYAVTELTPMCALFGGVLAQEITKQAGKYTPITQWFHFDAFELYGAGVPADATPTGTRYDHQIAVFGRAFQEKLTKQRAFLVGCGALGCEFVKAFAMMGLGVNGGQLHITDDDRIELSNLSRQFLFRRKHVGKSKSTSAAEAAVEMNPALAHALRVLETRVEPKSEDVFDDDFWDSLDFVVNALDNQIARRYTDGKCVLHHKPLFESGTLGTQANSVICLPGLTPSYSEGAVAGEEQGIAKCTLRNFPSDIVHCIEWAREKFDDLFVSGADAANSFLEDKQAFFHKLKQDPLSEADTLKTVKLWLELARKPTLETCVRLMHDEFIKNYRDAINDLTHNFPRDSRIKDSETGADLGPFWHGHKRFPEAAAFDASNAQHVDYVYHGTCILLTVFGLPEQSREEIERVARTLHAKPWVYTGAVIKLDEEKKGGSGGDADGGVSSSSTSSSAASAAASAGAASGEDDDEVIRELTTELSALPVGEYRKLNPADFEKDNDLNHHIDWITASTNLRAYNYHIKPAPRNQCRMVAGRIIPAIATTTASITGFIGLEMYKYVRAAPLEAYRACTMNLATNVFCCENLPDPRYRVSGMDPQTYMEVVAIPEKHTVWDKVVIDKPGLTLGEFLEEFTRVHHGCVIDMLATSTGTVLYNSIDVMGGGDRAQQIQARMGQPLVQVWEQVVGTPVFPANRKYLLFDCSVEDESGNPGIVPMIKYVFRK